MRAIFYAPGWPPARYPNGIVTSLGTLAPALRSAGCDVRIVAGSGDGAMQDGAILAAWVVAHKDREND